MPPAGASAFTTAEGMVNGVLSDTTDFRTAVEPAVAAGLAEMNVLMADVAYLTDSGDAGGEDLAHFAGRQTQEDVLVFLADKLSVGAGGAAHLPGMVAAQTTLRCAQRCRPECGREAERCQA